MYTTQQKSKLNYPFIRNRSKACPGGLVGWWPGNGSGGKIIDMSGYSNHGTLNGTNAAQMWTAGYQGGRGALSFDGSTNYVAITRLSYAGDFAASFWFKQSVFNANFTWTENSATTTDIIASLASTTQIFVRTAANQNNLFTVPTLSTNTIYLLSVTRSSGVIRVFLNGIQSTTGGISDAGIFNIDTIGHRSLPPTGTMEDFRLYSRAPSPAEVIAIYSQGRWRDRWVYELTDTMFAAPAATGIVFDAASNSGYQAATSSLSWSHNWQGTNRCLSIDVEMLSVTDTVTAMTYGGANCTFLGAQSVAGGTGRVECWRICSSDSGAPVVGINTISVTISGSLACAGTAVSRTGVNQTTPTEAFNSASGINVGVANASVVVTPTSDNTVVHAACATNDAAATANQTSRNDVTGTAGSGIDEDSGATVIHPAAAQTMTVAVAALKVWAIAGYAVRPTADPSSYSRTATEAPTYSDAATRVEVSARSTTESPIYSDISMRLLVAIRSTTESPTYSDSAIRVEISARSTTEAPAYSDSAARTLILVRAAAESPTYADTVARLLSAHRTTSETLTYSDSATVTKGPNRTSTENPTYLDAATRVEVSARSTVESPTYSDAGTRILVGLRTATESPSYSDSVTGVKTLSRVISESPTYSDTASRSQSLFRYAVENLAYADSAVATGGTVVTPQYPTIVWVGMTNIVVNWTGTTNTKVQW